MKYRETLRSSMQKRLNWAKCRLGCGLRWAQESCVRCGSTCAKGRCHGNHFWLSMGYNFSCMIASDALCDSSGRFSGSSYLMKT